MVSGYYHPCFFIWYVFNVMCYVWALVVRSLTPFALKIKVATLERVVVSSEWKKCLEQTVRLIYTFLCTSVITLSLDVYIVGTR